MTCPYLFNPFMPIDTNMREEFKMCVAHPQSEIGRQAAGPSSGILMCMGSMVEWGEPVGSQKCSELLLASLGHFPGSKRRPARGEKKKPSVGKLLHLHKNRQNIILGLKT